jgi:hypothetical protein
VKWREPGDSENAQIIRRISGGSVGKSGKVSRGGGSGPGGGVGNAGLEFADDWERVMTMIRGNVGIDGSLGNLKGIVSEIVRFLNGPCIAQLK